MFRLIQHVKVYIQLHANTNSAAVSPDKLSLHTMASQLPKLIGAILQTLYFVTQDEWSPKMNNTKQTQKFADLYNIQNS